MLQYELRPVLTSTVLKSRSVPNATKLSRIAMLGMDLRLEDDTRLGHVGELLFLALDNTGFQSAISQRIDLQRRWLGDIAVTQPRQGSCSGSTLDIDSAEKPGAAPRKIMTVYNIDV